MYPASFLQRLVQALVLVLVLFCGSLVVHAGQVRGNLDLAQAHWVAADTLVWNQDSLPEDATFGLHY